MAPEAASDLKIGDWQFHVRAHELVRNGETVRLEPRAASLLRYLAEHPGEPVSRSVLLETLWPGVVVGDEALTNAVNKLRRAFGDNRSNPRVIETIPKGGYRLIAQVSAVTGVQRARTSIRQGHRRRAIKRIIQRAVEVFHCLFTLAILA